MDIWNKEKFSYRKSQILGQLLILQPRRQRWIQNSQKTQDAWPEQLNSPKPQLENTGFWRFELPLTIFTEWQFFLKLEHNFQKDRFSVIQVWDEVSEPERSQLIYQKSKNKEN